MAYLALVLIVLAVNLLPAFGPPTWTILVVARLDWHLNPIALVILGAVSASTGRYWLATLSRRFHVHLPTRLKVNLEAARTLVQSRRLGGIALFALFVASPLPSAQLFVVAGLLELRLRPLTAVFFVGRLLSYSFYLSAATLAQQRMGHVLTNVFGSPWSIGTQVLLVIGVGLVPLINWHTLTRRSGKGSVAP